MRSGLSSIIISFYVVNFDEVDVLPKNALASEDENAGKYHSELFIVKFNN